MSTLLSALTIAIGAVFTWQGADNASWQDESSYVESGKPGAGDTVTIPRDMHPVVTDADFDYVSALELVELQVRCSVTFDVTGDRSLGCAVRQKAADISSYSREVNLIKRGSGRITLSAPTGGVSPYVAEIDVEEGTLRFSGAVEYGNATLACVALNVSGNAVFDLNGVKQISAGQLFGTGTITNSYSNGSSLIYIARERQTSEFGGKILGNISMRASYGGSKIDLTGTESDFHTFYSHGTGTVGIAKFGVAGQPSSIGTNEYFEAKANGARFVYLGNGETTDKKLKFDNSIIPMTIDGGANGGITFAGSWGDGTDTRYMRRLVLDGSNAEHECVFAGPYNDYGNSGYATYITKRGVGIWRFADNADRRNHGTIAVENGTLRFDSIAEAGEVCSLGQATALYSDFYDTKIVPENAVPYAMLIGGEDTEGTLEYTGSTAASCTSRVVAVKGSARLRNATDHDFRLKGVMGLGAGAKTLTLDGDSQGAENRLEDIADGEGALSIVKTGSGTWTLGGNQNLNGGSVDVKKGTLVIERKAKVPVWFRFTVKQCMMYSLVNRGVIANNDRSRSYDKTLFLNELAFYDADGARCNAGISTMAEPGTAVADMPAGSVLQTMGETVSARNPTRLFDCSGAGDGWHARNTEYDYYMTPETPSTWIQIVFRPVPADAGKVVAAFDFANTYTSSSNVKYQRWYQPDIFTIEGSADGSNWVVLTNVLSSAENITAGHWNSDDSAVGTADRPGCGYPINGLLHSDSAFAGVSSVSVAGNAVLRADIADGAAPEICGLTLDPEDGTGTIIGFNFAADGVLNLKSLPRQGNAFQYTLVDSSGFGNVANWDALLGGQPTASYSVSVRPNGSITINRRGFLLTIE